MARCGTFLTVEPAIFPTPKTQQVFQSKTVFDEQELDMEMNQALIPYQHKKTNKNQEIWYAKYAKVWALHNEAIKLLTWEPLLIVRLSIL